MKNSIITHPKPSQKEKNCELKYAHEVLSYSKPSRNLQNNQTELQENAKVSSFETDVGNLSIFIKRGLLPKLLKIGSRIHNTSEILKFIDYLNN